YTTTEEGSNNGALGEIKLANPNIKPSTSNNWDFEVAYYTESGGKLSVGYFYKTVTDQPISLSTFSGSETFNSVLPVLGLDPAVYEDWRLVTSTNAIGEQVQKGMEFEIRQDFAFLGGWGKYFQGFVSYSFTDLADAPAVVPVPITNPDGTTTNLTPTARSIAKRANKFGGAGLQFSNRRLSAQIRGTYRNENEVLPVVSSAVATNIIHRIQPAETRIDVNLTYMLSKRLSVFASARDVFNGSRREEAHDDLGVLAGYAQLHDYREFGTVWTVGMSGKF
ncbi:MAG TPA: TonB-dependent receptor, partial [Opitutaceae bacterium]|nr:TonB-dependent receptor [Opitutaceae bacterium]